jgi:hypothetical protein
LTLPRWALGSYGVRQGRRRRSQARVASAARCAIGHCAWYGLASWNELRDRVEELTLEFGAAVEQFIQAATDGRSDRAERLLALHPGIARANFHTALLVGDVETVERLLAAHPALATERGGPRGWEPFHYVCYTRSARTPLLEKPVSSQSRTG